MLNANANAIAQHVMETSVSSLAAAGCGVFQRSQRFVDFGGACRVFFDLASVTKTVTAWAVLKSGMDPNTPLAQWLPEASKTPSADVPLELLLAHRAGLVPHVPLYAPHAPLVHGSPVPLADALRTIAYARREDASGTLPRGGFPPVYSDLGYILVGAALARFLDARDAGEAMTQLVLRPLALHHAIGTARDLEAQGVDLATLAAPTESIPWRGGVVHGQVHDDNAWALTGLGGSGHAGLFGTIEGVVSLGLAFLDAFPTLDWLVRERPGGTLRAGFDGKSPEGSSAGSHFGPRSVGHLGFTGTSLWIDPDAGVVASLLTNRVHPTRDSMAIRSARPAAHDALFQRALALGLGPT
jgi:CubicO group peptidase (beta-lactamase class C family)